MIRSVLAVGVVLMAQAVSAQGITSVNFRQYMAGATVPVTPPFTVLITAVTCNQVPPVTQAVHTIVWDDPAVIGRVCVWTDPGTGPLFAAVYGALEGTLTNLAGTIESAESTPRTPFLRPPTAPTGVKVVR